MSASDHLRPPGATDELAFRVRLVDHDGVRVVQLAGELDIASEDQFREALATACSTSNVRVVVEASQLRFIDAAGLRALVSAHRGLLGGDRPGVVVRGAAGIVRRVFEITELTSLLDEPAIPVAARHVPAEASLDAGELDLARRGANLSVRDLFVAYFALGGTADLARFTAHLAGQANGLDDHQQDIAAHAINERLMDLGRTDRLSHAGERAP